MIPTVAAEPSDRSRKSAILVAARPVFVRYGYRKTSMDDVAKAAEVSRQGLYVHFASKEDLFREMIHQAISLHLHEARVALSDEARPIDQRLIAAISEWFGNREKLGEDSDLVQAGMQIAGAIIRDYHQQLHAEICGAIEKSELMSFYGARGISATDIATTLMATCRGISGTGSHETFLARVSVAIGILTAPCQAAESSR
jgi:AcrR family transcriptional regulator